VCASGAVWCCCCAHKVAEDGASSDGSRLPIEAVTCIAQRASRATATMRALPFRPDPATALVAPPNTAEDNMHEQKNVEDNKIMKLQHSRILEKDVRGTHSFEFLESCTTT
jgi:hypothetical protein